MHRNLLGIITFVIIFKRAVVIFGRAIVIFSRRISPKKWCDNVIIHLRILKIWGMKHILNFVLFMKIIFYRTRCLRVIQYGCQ